MRKLIVVFFFLITAQAFPADHFILDGGSGDGSAWNNALDDLPANLVRGDTYYIGDGTYSLYNFDDAESSTDYIYIKKSTTSDHGTEVGYTPTDHDGVATFGKLTFSTGYYEFDGATGGGPGSWTSGHGFRVTTSTLTDTLCFITYSGTNSVASNIHIYHTFFEHMNQTPESGGSYHLFHINGDESGLCSGFGCSAGGHIFSYNYFYGSPGYVFLFMSPGSILFEKNYIEECSHDALGPTGVQGGGFSTYGLQDTEFRYNVFKNLEGNGVIMLYDWDNTFDVENIKFHGNVVFYESGYDDDGLENIISSEGGAEDWDDVKIYNNSFVNLKFESASTYWFRDASGGTGNDVENNIFYGCGVNTSSNYGAAFFNIPHNYNWYYLNWDAAVGTEEIEDTGLAALESNEQVGTSDPFTDWENEDFTLSAATTAGDSTIGATYNTDMLGNTRGDDGVWDRGALEDGVVPSISGTSF
jgi:hypothetical protein